MTNLVLNPRPICADITNMPSTDSKETEMFKNAVRPSRLAIAALFALTLVSAARCTATTHRASPAVWNTCEAGSAVYAGAQFSHQVMTGVAGPLEGFAQAPRIPADVARDARLLAKASQVGDRLAVANQWVAMKGDCQAAGWAAS